MNLAGWLDQTQIKITYTFQITGGKIRTFFLIKPWLQVTFKQLAEAVVSH